MGRWILYVYLERERERARERVSVRDRLRARLRGREIEGAREILRDLLRDGLREIEREAIFSEIMKSISWFSFSHGEKSGISSTSFLLGALPNLVGLRNGSIRIEEKSSTIQFRFGKKPLVFYTRARSGNIETLEQNNSSKK